jgi:hypothetical protein
MAAPARAADRRALVRPVAAAGGSARSSRSSRVLHREQKRHHPAGRAERGSARSRSPTTPGCSRPAAPSSRAPRSSCATTRRSAAPTSASDKDPPHVQPAATDRLRHRHGRHLRLPRPGAGDDLPVHPPHQFRAGRDGDVLHLHRLPAAEVGPAVLGRRARHAGLRLRGRLRHRAAGSAAAGRRARAVGDRGLHRPVRRHQLAGRLDLRPPARTLPESVPPTSCPAAAR